MKILVVDDVPAVADTIARLLQRAGYKTYAAISADQALEQLRKREVDVVLLDYTMPEAETIKKCRPETPVVLMTGYPDVPLEAPVLHKPFKVTEAQKAIDRAVSRAHKGKG